MCYATGLGNNSWDLVMTIFPSPVSGLYIIFSQRISGIHRFSDFFPPLLMLKLRIFLFFLFFPPPPVILHPPFYLLAFRETNFKTFFCLPVQRDQTGYCKIVNNGAWFGGYVNQSLKSGPVLKSVAEFPLLLMILQTLPVLLLPRGVPLLLVVVPARNGARLCEVVCGGRTRACSWKICEQLKAFLKLVKCFWVCLYH